jgi:integrase
VFLVGGKGTRCLEPLGYVAVVRLFARKLDKLGLRTPETTPHALRHSHAAAMWEGGIRELSLQKPLRHASLESTVCTRVFDEAVLADYTRQLEGNR